MRLPFRKEPRRDSDATQEQRLRDSARAVAQREQRGVEELLRLERLTAVVRALQPAPQEESG